MSASARYIWGPFALAIWVTGSASRLRDGGFASEGIRLTLERAFTELGLHRVEANIIPDNAPSIATAKACGFRKEGYSPRYLKIAGRWQDHERWAITIEDWQADRDGTG